MTLTLAEVEHIAMLARLELSTEEKTPLPRAAFRHPRLCRPPPADRHQRIGRPRMPALPAGPPLRPDQVQPGLERSAALANAPQVENDQFRVPPVLE